MGFLSRDAILAAVDLRTEDCDMTPYGWGGTVRVQQLTGKQKSDYENEVVTQKGKETHVNIRLVREKLIVRCLVDEDGKRLFADNETELLGSKSAESIDYLFGVCQRLNGMERGAVEATAENFTSGGQETNGSISG